MFVCVITWYGMATFIRRRQLIECIINEPFPTKKLFFIKWRYFRYFDDDSTSKNSVRVTLCKQHHYWNFSPSRSLKKSIFYRTKVSSLINNIFLAIWKLKSLSCIIHFMAFQFHENISITLPSHHPITLCNVKVRV